MNIVIQARSSGATEQPCATRTLLQGPLLHLARICWVALTTCSLVIIVVSFAAYVTQLQTSCSTQCAYWQLSPDARRSLHMLGLSVGSYMTISIAIAVVFIAFWAGMGLMIFWRKSDDWMALLASLVLLMGSQGFFTRALGQSDFPWQILAQVLLIVTALFFGLFIALFPDGRFVPHWTRWVITAYFVLVAWLIPHFNFNPPFIQTTTFDAFVLLLFACLIVVPLFIAHGYRFLHISSSLERQQIKWVLFGLAITFVLKLVLLVLALFLFPTALQINTLPAWFSLQGLLLIALVIPLTIGIAILRYHLWDIDVVLDRTFVYALLTACVVGLYMLTVGLLSTLLQLQGNLLLSLLATGVVAILFQPLRNRLQKGVNHLLYGQRDEPYAVLAQLSQRLESALAPDTTLRAMVETVAQALKLPYAAILLKQQDVFAVAASHGRATEETLPLPLVYQGELIGQLQLAPRSPGEAFTPADRRLFNELAYQAGLALHAVRLTTDLQLARERLVHAREEERRRLRRDLHDGIGPTLASLSQRLDSVSRLIPQEPEAAVKEVRHLKTQVKATIADIRRLVYALRPPVLDELGLVSALREYAANMPPSDLSVVIEVPACLPPLPAAVEVAAYRIVLEALTNVGRHAHADHCLVRLALPDTHTLSIAIIDNGCGLPEDYHVGVGLASIRERTEELGGTCTLIPGAVDGTIVQVRLPLPKE